MAAPPDPNADPLGWLESRQLWQGALFRSMLGDAAAKDRLPPGTRLGSWRILDELGSGGMAVVYRACRDDGQFEQEVAIKCVPANPSTRDIELFRRERQIHAALNHPNIARLLDGGTLDDGRAWLAVELVEGRHIDAHADAEGLGLPARVRLLLQVVAAVSWAHQRLLLHRDIKPSNVLVDREGRVKLLDFGIAGWVDEQAQVHAYSPGWASPEQTRNDPVGPASDQYQLGQLLVRLAGDRLDAPGQAGRELRAIAAKARAEHPEDRYEAVAAFGADLQRWLDREPVQAMRGGWAYALRCAVRRRPYTSAAISAVLVAIVALVAGFSWRLNTERARAERAAAIAEHVNRFLTEDLLSQASPYVAPSPDVKVRDLLDRARVSIGDRFADEPEIEGGIRGTLARTYMGIGDFERAAAEFAEAIRLETVAPDADPARRIALEADAAEVRLRLGDVDGAVAAMESLEAAEHARTGGDNRTQLDLALRRIDLFVTAARQEEALSAIDAVLPRMAILPADDPLHVDIRAAEGEAAMRLGRLDRAEAALAEAEARIRRLRGTDSPDLYLVIQNQAILFRQRGDFARALALQRQVLDWQEARFGRTHPETLRTLNELASMLQDDRQHAAAEALFREVLAERERRLGVGDVLTRNSLNNLGLVLSLQGKLDEAEVHYRRALDVERGLFGADAFDVLVLAHNLAGLLRKRDDLAGAEALARDTVERAERTLSAARYEPALFRVGLAQTLQRQGRKAEALAEFDRARERLVGLFGAEDARVQKVDAMRAALAQEP